MARRSLSFGGAIDNNNEVTSYDEATNTNEKPVPHIMIKMRPRLQNMYVDGQRILLHLELAQLWVHEVNDSIGYHAHGL